MDKQMDWLFCQSEGERAYHENRPLSDNPFIFGNPNAEAWELGWIDACESVGIFADDIGEQETGLYSISPTVVVCGVAA